MNIVGTSIEIVGREYISPNGYPKFGFWFDEETKKYSIANVETKEATEPFVDEVIYSELPLETWTANYVVVRIKNRYYLADNNGNCYFESYTPYIICRNVFVLGDLKHIIVKANDGNRLEKITVNITIKESGGYKFALADGYIINVYGKIVTSNEVYDIDGIHENWCVSRKISGLNIIRIRSYLDEDFNIIFEAAGTPMLRGNRSKTYEVERGKYYSRYFKSRVDFYRIENLEIIVYKGKTYLFKENGESEVIDGTFLNCKAYDKHFVYRIGDTVTTRDFNGNVIAEEKLTPKEEYNLFIAEELLECINVLRRKFV